MTRALWALLAAPMWFGCVGSDDSAAETTGTSSGTTESTESTESTDTGTAAPICTVDRPALPTPRLTVNGPEIRDALGRQVLLRGVNAGGQSKLPPFVPFTDTGAGFDATLAQYADRVVAWGHDVVRLPVTWDAVEPERGQVDAQFLARYVAMVQAFADRDVWVIVDFHQDVFARPFCGDGFPLWAILDPLDDTQQRDCHSWFTGYLSDDEVKAAYDHFWANDEGLQDAFEQFWRHLAAATWPIERVVGFEVINEPGWGSAKPGDWAKDVLTPFYSKMIAVVREVAPGAPIFFDSTGTDAVAATTALERPTGEGLVFAPHWYDPLAITRGIWSGAGDVAGPIGQWRALGDAWQVPVLLGEFGIRTTAQNGAEYVRLNWDALDEHLMHGTQWEYSWSENDWNAEGMSLIDADGQEAATLAEAIRAYPAAVAGTTTSFEFDREARTGTLVFEAVAGGVTEVVAPLRLYPDGVRTTLAGVDGCVQYSPATQRILVRADGAGSARLDFGPETR